MRSPVNLSSSAPIYSTIMSFSNALRIHPRRALPCHWVRTAVAVVDVFQIESMDVTREVSMSISRLFHTSQTSKDG